MTSLNLTHLLIAVFIFGLSNGLSPGPTLTLVISQTIQHNLKAGIKVACAPILFGIVIIPLTVFVAISLNNFKPVMGLITLVGSVYIAYLGFKQIFSTKINFDVTNVKPRSFWMGVAANFSSPYAYLFWFTVGGPLIARTKDINLWAAIMIALVYYTCLVGSKILVALIIEKSRSFIDNFYNYFIRGLGVILIVFACITAKDAVLLTI